MYDNNDTEYFRRPEPSSYSSSTPYYYSGSYQGNPFDVGSRRYDYNPGTYQQNQGNVPPYNPGNQYGGYQDPYQAPQYFNQYPSYQAPYQSSYQQPMAPSQVPPYVPAQEQQRSGSGFNSLFGEYSGYSAPINTPVSDRRVPVPTYSGPAPVNGFANMYTQPPVPADPQINWGAYGPGRRMPRPDSISMIASWNTTDAIFEPKQDSWVDMYKRNFKGSEL